MIRKILIDTENDPCDSLRCKNKYNVPSYDNFIDDLIDTLSSTDGVGLAAPQIGLPFNVFVIRNGHFKVYINPKIVAKSIAKVSSDEGCLSIPNVTGKVMRHQWVDVEYQDEMYNIIKERLDARKTLDAIIFQHEYDHLQGILFTDRIEKKICPVCKREHKNEKSIYCSKECFLSRK